MHGRAQSVKMQAGMVQSRSRKLLQQILQTHEDFEAKLGGYTSKTDDGLDFYANRLALNDPERVWGMVDEARQCRCCGHLLLRGSCEVKLLSCSKCKLVHYCDVVCQKRDWKQVHRSVCRDMGGKKCIEDVMHICVRALTLMTLPVEECNMGFSAHECMKLDDFFSFDKADMTVSMQKDIITDHAVINPYDNPVCNHFRQKKEGNRILYPIWDRDIENLVFVPISLDFLRFLGAGPSFLADIETTIQNNDNVYFVLVEGTVDGKHMVVGVNSWVSFPGTHRKLCQKVRGVSAIQKCYGEGLPRKFSAKK